jgi:hypothetical protein
LGGDDVVGVAREADDDGRRVGGGVHGERAVDHGTSLPWSAAVLGRPKRAGVTRSERLRKVCVPDVATLRAT